MPLAAPVHADADSPMYWRRDFPGRLDQAQAVRAFAAHLLAGCPVLDDILLVLNELVVNALRHTRSGDAGGRFAVEVLQDMACVTVQVADQGGMTEPQIRDVIHLEESGRGLFTVEAVAASWSWSGDSKGRSVRASFPTP
jgi:anti-sigma regulatory factor (Ser/Thr protein kinase)